MTVSTEQLNKSNAHIISWKNESFTDCIAYVVDKPTKKELRNISRKQFPTEYVSDYLDMLSLHDFSEWYFEPDTTQILLVSYESLVAMYLPEFEIMVLFPAWKYSTTTVQHVSKFMKKMHFPASGIDDYLANDHVIFASSYRMGAYMLSE